MVTRHAKAGKGRRWTNNELKAIPIEWKGDTISDGDSLFGEVRVSRNNTVSVRFKFGFRWQNQTAWFACGTFPKDSIADIRAQRDKAKDWLTQGLDPRLQKQVVRIEAQVAQEATLKAEKAAQIQFKTVQNLFDDWCANGVARKDGNAELERSFKKDILPLIGSKPVKEVLPEHLMYCYRQLLERGTQINTRERSVIALAADVRQMFKWAEQRQPWRALLIEGNPAMLVNVHLLISDDYSEERERVLSDMEIQKLWQIWQQEEQQWQSEINKRTAQRPFNPAYQCAVWLCLSTLCRIGELSMAKWEHVDFDKRIWFIPKENVKSTRGKKQEHYIHLSDFALQQFAKLRELAQSSEWCFPSSRSDEHIGTKVISKAIGDRQVRFKERTKPLSCRRHDNSLVLSEEEWTPHDLRRTGATIMQRLKVDMDIIDRCQNRVLNGSRVRRHYLKHDYAEEKQAAWDRLGDYLLTLIQAA